MSDNKTETNEKRALNRAEYRNKVAGCWMGKNIGGTIGAPFEGQRTMNDAAFYSIPPDGKPLPNDDLDLQLVWLLAAETFGVWNLNERILGEYWISRITGPWNEYGVCKANIRNGLTPPLSGGCNNERWHASNGAWIRSEIWACIFPGAPSEAVQYAYYDACCDHYGEGVFAEMFTVAMESAAFVEDDIMNLIAVGLAAIPEDCRVARAVRTACRCYEDKTPFREAREIIVQDSADLGWFQAPGNIGFTVLALLYGERDFGRTVALATNCGDDTDCTAGTAGALLGIVLGREAIPEEWTKPIGESIVTGSIDAYIGNRIPKDLATLTARVAALAEEAALLDPVIGGFTDKPTRLPKNHMDPLFSGKAPHEVSLIWSANPFEFRMELSSGAFICVYENGPYGETGKPLSIKLGFIPKISTEVNVDFRLKLPEGWTASPAASAFVCAKCTNTAMTASMRIVPGIFENPVEFIPVEIRRSDRTVPDCVMLPVQCGGPLELHTDTLNQAFWSRETRISSRI